MPKRHELCNSNNHGKEYEHKLSRAPQNRNRFYIAHSPWLLTPEHCQTGTVWRY